MNDHYHAKYGKFNGEKREVWGGEPTTSEAGVACSPQSTSGAIYGSVPWNCVVAHSVSCSPSDSVVVGLVDCSVRDREERDCLPLSRLPRLTRRVPRSAAGAPSSSTARSSEDSTALLRLAGLGDVGVRGCTCTAAAVAAAFSCAVGTKIGVTVGAPETVAAAGAAGAGISAKGARWVTLTISGIGGMEASDPPRGPRDAGADAEEGDMPLAVAEPPEGPLPKLPRLDGPLPTIEAWTVRRTRLLVSSLDSRERLLRLLPVSWPSVTVARRWGLGALIRPDVLAVHMWRR